MLPALVGFAAKALLPSEKKVDKDKFFEKKKASSIQKIDDESAVVKQPTVQKKTVSTNLLLPPAEIKALPPAAEVKKDVKTGRLDDIFDRVGETLQGIIDVLSNRNQTQKEEETNKKQQAKVDEKKEKEEKLEKDAKKKPFKMPNIKAPEDKFNLMRFFGNVLLGSLALAIFNNLEQIIETLKNVFQTIKDFITKVGEFFSPVWDGLKWITGEGTKLVGKLLGVPSENLDSKDIKKNIDEIAKKIPFLENLFKGIQSTIDSLRGGGESSQPNAGGGGGDGGGYVSPAVGSKAGAYDIASKIGANKQQWDTYRNTIAQIESGGRYDVAGGSGKYYDGRYQMGGPAKTDAARILGIPDPGHSDNPNDPRRVAFRKNPELQERMFAAYTLANHGYLSSDRNYQSKQTVEQKLQVLGYAHNQGAGGASKWMRTGKVGKDGFGTSGTKYSNALREAFKRSPSYRQQQADTTAQQAAQQAAAPAQTQAPPAPTLPSPQQASAAAPSSQAAAPAQAQVSSTQAPPAVSASVPQIMQQADYEIPGGTPSSTILPIPIGGSSSPMMMGGGGTRVVPIGMSKQELLNSYYQTQLIGFLYKQG
jgi:hypothetical protein